MTAARTTATISRWYPAAAVRCALVDGGIVLLDLRSGQYVTLDRVASALWQALVTEADDAARMESLRRRFDAPEEKLAADLTAFSERCAERGYLQHEHPAAATAPLRSAGRGTGGWLAARAWWSIRATSRSLATHGFAPTYAEYASLAKPDPDTAASPETVARAERAFAFAENLALLPGALRIARSDCLPRSLALYRFMLSAGVPAEHVIGVMLFPFTAHAWVECAGRVLCDPPATVGSYTVLARL